MQRLRQRFSDEICWAVWRDGQQIVKEYRVLKWRGWLNPRWRREHHALRRLNRHAVPAPRSFGYESLRRGVLRQRREFAAGRIPERLSDAQTEDLGCHLAAVHGAAVTNGDAALDNLLVADDGRLMFIDYGRARVFRVRSPLFYLNAGKELARFRRRIFSGKPDQWRLFFAAYSSAGPRRTWAWALTRWSQSFWSRRWGLAG